MPLRTEHINFDEEVQRLEHEREELAEQVAEADDAPERLVQEGRELDAHLQGVRWARDRAARDDAVGAWDRDVDGIDLAGLTGGEFGHVEDAVVADALDRGDTRVGDGLTRIYYVAKATRDAPYVDDTMSFEDRIHAVSQLPVPFLKWAKSRVDELTRVGGEEGNSFDDLVAAKQTTSDDD